VRHFMEEKAFLARVNKIFAFLRPMKHRSNVIQCSWQRRKIFVCAPFMTFIISFIFMGSGRKDGVNNDKIHFFCKNYFMNQLELLPSCVGRLMKGNKIYHSINNSMSRLLIALAQLINSSR
jgi:hypothetical protein